MRYKKNYFFFGHHFKKAIKYMKTRKFSDIGLQILIFSLNLIGNDPIAKDKEKIQHSDQSCKAISEKIQSEDRITKLKLLTLILDSWSVE